MQSTKNYQLVKQELTDKADITQISGNWDTIDTQLKKLTDEKFNKTGGEVGGTLTVSGKVTANDGLDVVGGIVNGGEYKLKVDITKGQTPSKAKFATIGIYDNSLKEGYRLGRVQYGISTNNTASIAMYVNRPNDAESEDPSGILVQWLNGTTARISVTHHPETASNDKSVATTYWVRNLKATTSQYGLTKLADETALLNESGEATLTVDKAYQLNDFRRKETAYTVGDKVNCAFNFGFFLECTQAGTTSAESLDTRNVTFGQVITDGTAQWTVRAHVKSINGVVPDANGDVEIDVDMTEYALEQDILDACDKALENSTNPGQVDLATVLSAVAALETRVVAYETKLAEIEDYVVETGTTNGIEWIKYKSGKLEMSGNETFTVNGDVKGTITFPFEFETAPQVYIAPISNRDISVNGTIDTFCFGTKPRTTNFDWRFFGFTSNSDKAIGFNWRAYGKLKTSTSGTV